MSQRHPTRPPRRRGIVIVLAAFLLCVVFAFVSLSIDSGRVVLTQTEMQNAVDAAALAASQEITAAIHAAGQGEGSATIDGNSIAVQEAKQMAAQVAELNGVYIDPETDVSFGKRGYDSASDSWPVAWGATPYNVVRVVARRTGSDLSAPDGEFPLAFGWALGKDSVPIEVSATAFVEARDLVLVLDFSGSMSDDTELGAIGNFTQAQVEASLDRMWDELVAADPKWPGTSESKFPASGFGLINSYAGTYVSSDDTSDIREALGLNETDEHGDYARKYPQSGRYSSGTPKGEPSNSTSRSLWDSYIHYVKHRGGPYHKRYGYRTLMDYIQQNNTMNWTESEDLWRTSHYPFTAVKNGASLFLQFLDDLDFGDEVGVVSYGSYSVWETEHYDGEVSIDISDDPINGGYATLDTIQRRHQAGHYDINTNIGAGMCKAREMLVGSDSPGDQGHIRYGARPTVILMTDGQANHSGSGWSMPSGFDWDDWTDYDGDGEADYSTNNSHKKYAFYEALEAVERGVTIHTLAVGANADRDLMRAIAHAGGGIFISVPGGSTIAEMESQMVEAFGQIAAKVPPAQLVYELSAE